MQITDIFKLMETVNDPRKLIIFFQNLNLISSSQICECRLAMSLVVCKRTSDNYIWRCPKKCKQISIRKESFFERSRLPIKTILTIIYFWIQDIPTNRIKSMLNISKQTLADWNNFLYEICSSSLLALNDEERMIGGDGIIVEIDETLVSKKWKYYRGVRYPEIWLFGGTERESKKWFGQIVLVRDRENLTNLIKRFIKPNSIIYSDRWSAYWTENYNLNKFQTKITFIFQSIINYILKIQLQMYTQTKLRVFGEI